MPDPRGGGGTAVPPLLEARGVRKAFPGVQALRDVDIRVVGGSVHALVGENGAGKSTLTSILGGVTAPDAGQLLLNGAPVTFDSPHDALAAGIVVVYQELSLLPHLSVAENMFLGHEPTRRGVIRRQQLHDRARQVLESLGMGRLPVDRPIRRLSIAQQQVVEIAKALAHDARLLIMDEPSAVLAGAELDRLFELIRGLSRRGVAIVYISHRLSEVAEIADEVTILRDGAVVSSGPASLSRDEIVRRMVGHSLDETFAERRERVGDVALAVRGLQLPGTEPAGVSLTVRRGEIVGVAGLMGSGRSRLARALVGLEEAADGTIEVAGRRLRGRGPREAARQGLALIPEDRKGMGLILDFAVRANVSLPVLQRVSSGGLLSPRREQELATRTITELGIRTSGPAQITRHLSGGNQQKVALGKWLATRPTVLVLDEPLRGVDVGAKAEIYDLIQALADRGTAILLISSELLEILGLSDRVIVMRDGAISGELARAEATEAAILALAIGEAVHQPSSSEAVGRWE